MPQHYSPLNSSSSDHDYETEPKFLQLSQHSQRKSSILHIALLFTSLSLLITNGFWIFYYASFSASTTIGSSQTSRFPSSYWIGAEKTISKTFHWNTPYSEENKTETNVLWKDLFPIGQGVVYLPTPWAESQNLPASSKNVNDESQSTYFVAAYHQLHCLSVIRSALYKFKEGREKEVKWEHTIHCLDSLRQSAMCRADDTLLYTEDGNVFGDGQVRECRDWERLQEWVVQRHA